MLGYGIGMACLGVFWGCILVLGWFVWGVLVGLGEYLYWLFL